MISRSLFASDEAWLWWNEKYDTVNPPVRRVSRATKIYIVGSLKNAKVQAMAVGLRKLGYDVFDDWHAAGPDADDYWQAYEKARGRSYSEALAGAHAQDVFAFDKRHIDAADVVILALPAGKSGHLEFGYAIGSGKKGIICLDGEPERFDVMYNFATAVVNNLEDLEKELGTL